MKYCTCIVQFRRNIRVKLCGIVTRMAQLGRNLSMHYATDLSYAYNIYLWYTRSSHHFFSCEAHILGQEWLWLLVCNHSHILSPALYRNIHITVHWYHRWCLTTRNNKYNISLHGHTLIIIRLSTFHGNDASPRKTENCIFYYHLKPWAIFEYFK